MRLASIETGRPSRWRWAALCLLLAGALQIAAQPAKAQNPSHSVVSRTLKFARGSSGTQVNGRIDHATSHVYALSVREGQTLRVDLDSPGAAATLSVIAPNAGTLPEGFGVTHWEGPLPESGRYELVLVMNDAARRRVPYRLQVAVH
jgi:hypothetical protein